MNRDHQYSWSALQEAQEWATGRRSHNNEMLLVEADPAHRPQTLAAIAQVDAAEVVMCCAVATALLHKERVRS